MSTFIQVRRERRRAKRRAIEMVDMQAFEDVRAALGRAVMRTPQQAA